MRFYYMRTKAYAEFALNQLETKETLEITEFRGNWFILDISGDQNAPYAEQLEDWSAHVRLVENDPKLAEGLLQEILDDDDLAAKIVKFGTPE